MTRTYPDRPIVGVGVVVIREDRVLLIRRGQAPWLGEWSIPGGAQELGETVAEAAHREVAEETGIAIDIRGLIDVVDAIQQDEADRTRMHYTLVDLLAVWKSGKPRPGDDAAALEWVSFERLESLPIWTRTREIILKGRSILSGA